MAPSPRFAACTIVARNYTAYAEILQASFATWNPDAHFITLVIDGTEEDRSAWALDHVVLPSELGLAPEDLEPMIVMYSVMELATALKPALLQSLTRSYEAVVYLDPDIWVLGNLQDVFEDAAEHGIVLTPHALAPISRDGLEISEKTIMHSGIFNLGFIAVGRSAEPFLSWWHERLRTDAVVDFENALFTDQRWIDWVPALFDHKISRDPGLNVAYWNVQERPITRNPLGGFCAAGVPLRFFHFSGFDTSAPWILSRFMGEHPRVLVSEQDVLRTLCFAYADALTAAGHARRRELPYGYEALPGGPVLTPGVRRVYRDALKGSLPLEPPPLRPVTDPGGLRQWLRSPVQSAPWTKFAPADIVMWRTVPGLATTFPSLFGAASSYFRDWLDTEAAAPAFYSDLGIEAPERTSMDAVPRRRTSGWSVVACGDPEPSGEARGLADRVAWEIVRAGYPVEVAIPPRTDQAQAALWTHRGVGADDVHDNVIVCVDVEHFSPDRVVQALAGRRGRTVALWLSPHPEISPSERQVLEMFDEVWAVSASTAVALADATGRHVPQVRIPWDDVTLASVNSEAPDWLVDVMGAGPLFVVPLDARSDFERQNPVAAVGAFTGAFDEGEDARLVIHVRHGRLTRRQSEVIRHAIADRKDVGLVHADSTPDEMLAVLRSADAVICLHRSSALGMVISDAVAAETPVVVTGHGAPLTYLDETTAQLIPFVLVSEGGSEVTAGSDGALWAEPDGGAATRALRVVVDDNARVRRMAQKARRTAWAGVPRVRDVVRSRELALMNGQVDEASRAAEGEGKS